MKTRFKANEDLPQGKIIIISSVFKENVKFYFQVFLYDCFYEYEENVDSPDM